MKSKFLIALLIFLAPFGVYATEIKALDPGQYHLIIEGFDWGPAVNRIVIGLNQTKSQVDASDYEIFINRSSTLGEIPVNQTSGKREVVYAYLSDENGNRVEEGIYATLVLAVSPIDPLGSAIQYLRAGGRGSNVWIDYGVTVIDVKSGLTWTEEAGRIRPIVDEFELDGMFNHSGVSLPFASFTPNNVTEKAPLIIWLHGGGEGGSDPTIALMGNKAFNYASPEIQTLFGEGAYVLVPQAPTFWMQASNGMTRGKTDDIYHEALFALIQDYVSKNPQIDPSRIYVGGCSNGGYMSLKLIIQHPEYFAAGFISALAYNNEFISDEMVNSFKDVPIWFVHSKDDQVTRPEETVVPLYDRLKKADAKNVHFTFYDHVIDITGFYGGEGYHYNGHWSWIYSHANLARTNLDGSPVLVGGRPVTIMEWMAAQRLK